MFTGIIKEVGAIARISGQEVTVLAKAVLKDVEHGDSIAVDGACLSVVSFEDDRFTVQVSPETFARTTLGQRRVSDAVNLERALMVGDRFDGHMVQGHVDGVGQVKKIQRQGDFQLWHFQAPDDVAKYLAPKGSIAIDGISLTVVEPEGDTFAVAIIPETLQRTTLHSKQPGDAVNMEADIIGKHVYHYLKGSGSGGLTQESLKRYGFG